MNCNSRIIFDLSNTANMKQDNNGKWVPYNQMTIIQKINVKANSVGAAIKFNEAPNMQPPLMFFALTGEHNYSPDVYNTPFKFARYK